MSKIDVRCFVCRNSDRRRMIELAWNDGMTPLAIANVFDGVPNSKTIAKHIKDHSDGVPAERQIETQVATPARERVLALQNTMIDEIERRITVAKQTAESLNRSRAGKVDDNGDPLPLHDWSEFFDVLDKDNQAAISSILKTQAIEDKREKATADLKLGLFEAMSRSGLAPASVVGAPALQSGEENEGNG